MDDWSQQTRVLAEAGKAGVRFPNSIDIKQVHFDSDGIFLYVFLQCRPTPAQRYKVEQLTGGIAELLIDSDNDRSTGSKQAEVHFHPDRQDGLEVRLPIEIYVGSEWKPGAEPRMYYACGWRVEFWDAARKEFAGKDFGDSLVRWSTEETPELIADGKDGVELAIPLKDLGIQPGTTVRILLKERANCWDKDGFNEFTLELKP